MRTSVRKVLAIALMLAGAGCSGGAGVEPVELVGSVGVLHVERDVDERELQLDGSAEGVLVDGTLVDRALVDGALVDAELVDGTLVDGTPVDGTSETSSRTELSAAFARYRGLDSATVLGLLGGRSPAETEACTFVGADDAIVAADAIVADERWDAERTWGEVELLDVGTMRVRVADTEASLSPRAFPDLASVLAGVFYAGDASLAIARADVDEYTFRADGSAEVPAFEAIVPAPAAPADLRVDALAPGQRLAASRDAGLDVTWTAAAMRDLIEIEIRSGGDVLACASRDDGQFRIDAESLATLAPDAAASMIVRRVRVTPVDVPGLDDAFARIAVTREIAVELR